MKKNLKEYLFRFDNKEDCQNALNVINIVRKGSEDVVVEKEFIIQTSVVARYNSSYKDLYLLDLKAGDEYVALDKQGEWFYGFNKSNPSVKGLYPSNYVEVMPPGCLLGNVLGAKDWDRINAQCERFDLGKGDRVEFKEGDIWYVLEGSLEVKVEDEEGTESVAGTISKGETVGELMLYLGGSFEGKCIVSSDSVSLFRLNKATLRKLLLDEDFAARFYKSQCAIIVSRLARVQMWMEGSRPTLPVKLRINLEGKELEEFYGSSVDVDSYREMLKEEKKKQEKIEAAMEAQRSKQKLLYFDDAPQAFNMMNMDHFGEVFEEEAHKKDMSKYLGMVDLPFSTPPKKVKTLRISMFRRK